MRATGAAAIGCETPHTATVATATATNPRINLTDCKPTETYKKWACGFQSKAPEAGTGLYGP
jgi:hypothetical protein